jgi:electron transfer flavoprotein beta subunit
MIRAATFVSMGRHPASGRQQRAAADALAVELGRQRFGARLTVVHAGNASEPFLRDYLGMGIPELTVLELAAGFDPTEPLLAWLRRETPAVVLMGPRAETGDGSGMLPYVLAEAWGAALVSNVVDVEIASGELTLVQGEADGGRRKIAVELPVVAVLMASTQRASQISNRARIAGIVQAVKVQATSQSPAVEVVERAARHRPKRIKRMGATLSDRLAALTGGAGGGAGGGGTVIQNVSPTEAAEAVFNFLQKEGVLDSRSSSSDY